MPIESYDNELPGNATTAAANESAGWSAQDLPRHPGPSQPLPATASVASSRAVDPRLADLVYKRGDKVLRAKKIDAHRRPDSFTQSLVLLATMALVLMTARFAVPRIVEEIRYGWYRGELRAEYERGAEGIRSISLDALGDASQMITSVVGPSVVHIDVQRGTAAAGFDQTRMLSHSMPAADQGSGVLVDAEGAEGYVLTNRHVIADGHQITVKLSDGRRVPATVVGTDALTDLAVLRIDADRLIPIGWGDSDRCKVGSPVWAVGSPFGLDRTVTFGILSGKHRMVRASTQYQDFMQSDVAVNPGNSGGPLVDARGTLIGINTAIVGDTYQGVSFSIPSNVARQVYEGIRQTGRVERAWLGVQLAEVDQAIATEPLLQGAQVAAITTTDSPAAMAGLQAGDRIVTIDDVEVRDMGHLMRMIGGTLAGSTVRIGIQRADETLELQVTLGARPEPFNE
jgi:S1-C subfamily serine protease